MRAIDADVLKKDLTRFYDNEVTAKQLIDEQPTIEPEPQWIECRKRLPEKEMNCLVTDRLGNVHKVTFYHALDGRESYFSGCYCVRAWMPLPTPYEPQESEEV